MNNKNPNPLSNPQLLYKADDANRQDFRRKLYFRSSLYLGTFLIILYLVIFWFYIKSIPLLANPSSVAGIFLFVLIIVPIVIMVIGLKTAYGLYKKFAEAFYKVPDDIKIEPLIERKRYGLSMDDPNNPAFLLIGSHKLDDKFSWAYSMGGPVKLIVLDGYAVYLERSGKFSRVVGSGGAFLERYETIREIVDLRLQVKDIDTDVWTKDGIKLMLHMRVKCQILSAETAELSQEKDTTPETDKRFYPFYDTAVKNAVETAQVRLNNNTNQLENYDWIAGVCGNVEGHIREHVSSHTIDELLRSEGSGILLLDTAAPQHQGSITGNGDTGAQLYSIELRNTLQNKVNKDVQRLGARLIELQIVKVDKSPVVSDQWKENWGAEWNRRNAITAGEGEAYKIRAMETAHAEAQKDMILAIVEGLEKMNAQQRREHLLLSLSGMLENSLVDPYVRAALPRETLETLEKIKTMLDEPLP